jgi:hypothetical protein
MFGQAQSAAAQREADDARSGVWHFRGGQAATAPGFTAGGRPERENHALRGLRNKKPAL